jgi:hypothetical protein
MKTDKLIAVLAEDARAERSLAAGLWALLLPAMTLSALFLLGVFGPRPDLLLALADPVSGLRYVLPLTLVLTGLAVALRLARPEARPGRVIWGFWAVAALAAVLWLWAFATTPGGALGMAIQGKTIVTCLTTIPVLSLLPVVAVLAMLRRGVVTRPNFAGAVAGLAGGGAGAMIYALHCTEDHPLFFVTWYGAAILIVTVLSTLAGRRLLRG